MWATFLLLGRKLRIGAPELQIDLKLKVTGTKNRREKGGGVINGAHMTCECPGKLLTELLTLKGLLREEIIYSESAFNFLPILISSHRNLDLQGFRKNKP